MGYIDQFLRGVKGNKFRLSQLEGAGLLTFGNIFFVNSATGSDTAYVGKEPATPLATIGAAISAATASNGDVIIVLPHHSETVTSAIAMSKAGISLIGLGAGLARPSITGNGTIDAINVTGANCLIQNFQFPAPSTDDQTSDINVAAGGLVIRDTYHIGSQTSKNKTDIITVASGGNDLLIEGLIAYNTVVDAVSCISLEAAVARAIIRNCAIQGSFTTAPLMDEAAATNILVENNLFKNTKTTGSCMNFTNNSTGVARFNHNSGRDTTLANNVVAGTGMDFFENRATEEAALNGAILPAADTD